MYEDKKCEYCGEQFAKNDDVVVCPECGAPYHRRCWQEHGECAHAAEHKSGYGYQEQPSQETEQIPEETEDFIAKIKSQMAAQNPSEAAGESVPKDHCERCGAKLISGDEYCVYCGHKQGDPISGRVRNHTDKDPLGGFEADEKIGGERVADLALIIRSNAVKMLPKLKAVSERRVKLGWSWPSFFFGYLYYFFRKLYKYGIIMIMAQVLLFNVLNIAMGDPMSAATKAFAEVYNQYAAQAEEASVSEEEVMEAMQQKLIDSGIVTKTYALVGISLAVSNVACALLFDYLYLRHCKDTIARMNKSAEILGGMSKADYRLNLLARGGVSIFGIIIGYFARMAIEQIVAFIMSVFSP